MMARLKLTAKDLNRELKELEERYPKLTYDDLFILWFLHAYVTESELRAVEALCGGSGEKDVDAILIDDQARAVVIVQGKYRKGINRRTEHRQALLQFANLANESASDNRNFSAFSKDLAPVVHDKLAQARNRINARGYRLVLYYVTTGK